MSGIDRTYVTGDIHGDINIQKIKYFKKVMVPDLDRGDVLIVCGDMGILWDGGPFDKYIKRYWEAQPFTVVFIDGNHENFNELAKFPIIEKWGGRVQQIAENVYHACRGEILMINGHSFFCFGGAESHDKCYRKEGLTWWPQEMPSQEEYKHGLLNLEKVSNCVDFIITHTLDKQSLKDIFPAFETNPLAQYFTFVRENVKYQHWFCGHYHIDQKYPRVILIYNSIIEIN